MAINPSNIKQLQRKAQGLCVALLLICLCMVGCTSETKTYSKFYSIPSGGWSVKSPLHFAPDSLDSLSHFDVKLAVRHNTDYAYQDLPLAIDFIDQDGNVKLRQVTFHIADEHGHWKGSGFGALYQCEQIVARDVPHASIKRIVVWNVMQTREKMLQGISDVGVTLIKTGE